MSGVAAVSKIFMTFGAYTGVYNMNPFLKILYDTDRTRPLLTGKKNKGNTNTGCDYHYVNGSGSVEWRRTIARWLTKNYFPLLLFGV